MAHNLVGQSLWARGSADSALGLFEEARTRFEALGHPDYVWYTLAAHVLLAIVVINLFVKFFGAFQEREA